MYRCSFLILFCSVITNSQKEVLFAGEDLVFAAFGDFDSDKFTDVFAITENGKSVKLLKGQKIAPFLLEKKEWSCSFSESNYVIVALIPGDFRGKAAMDTVVVAKDNTNNDVFYLFLLLGNKTHVNCSGLNEPPFAVVNNQPLALDINGDMAADLFAEAHNDSERYFWLGSNDGHFKQVLWSAAKSKYNTNSNHMKNPSSNAFIDLNGDSVTDIFVSGEQFMEYWFSPSLQITKDCVKIHYPEKHSKDSVVGESTFFDIDSDGVIDHLLPVCSLQNCSLYVWREFFWETVTSVFYNFDNSSSPLLFFPQQTFNDWIFPLRLRHADVDGDGFPDLLALMKSARQQHPLIVILQNVPSDKNSIGRTFVPQWNIRPDLTETYRPVVAAFFDLKEDGKADVLISYKENENENKYKMAADFNTQMVDACFLKVLVTTGLCYGRCPPVQSSPMDPTSNSIPYGTNLAGPLVIYELVNTEGFKRKSAAGQLSQSADFSLQMPYAIFGLGQQPNFVDNLTASIPSGTTKARYQSWPQIIPDSQVVVIPYPPSDPRLWRSKLFITPSDIVISTLITLTSICCLLILIIAVLHRKEVLEDLAEHEEYRRHWPECK